MDNSKFLKLRKYLRSGGKIVAKDIKSGKMKLVRASRRSKANRLRRGKGEDDHLRLMLLQQRRVLVAKLRAEGLSYQEIAHVVRATVRGTPEGYDRNAVRIDMEQMLDTVHQQGYQEVQRMRALELMRMDWLTVKLHHLVEEGGIQITRAIELYLKVSERRAKLAGLDAPVQVDATLFGDIQVIYAMSTAQYDQADKHPESFIDADYTVADNEQLSLTVRS